MGTSCSLSPLSFFLSKSPRQSLPLPYSIPFKKFYAAPPQPHEIRGRSTRTFLLDSTLLDTRRRLWDGYETNGLVKPTALFRFGRNLSPGHQFKSVPWLVFTCLQWDFYFSTTRPYPQQASNQPPEPHYHIRRRFHSHVGVPCWPRYSKRGRSSGRRKTTRTSTRNVFQAMPAELTGPW